MRTSTPLHLSMATRGLHWTTRHCGGKDGKKETVREKEGGEIIEDVDERERKTEREEETSRTNRPKTKY